MAARRRFRWVFVVLGVIAVALVLWVVFHKPPAKPAKPQPIPVTTVKALSRDVQVEITALGAAQAWKSDMIIAQVTGKILSAPFVEGADVREGQLLAQIDPAPYRAALLQAQGALVRDQASLAEARIDLARYQRLAAQDSIARQTLDTQAALVKQDEGTVLLDKGAVDAAKVSLGWTSIRAPIAGRAGVRLVDPGNIVSAGATPSASSTTTTAGGSGLASSTTTSAAGGGIVIINQIEPIAVTFTVPQGDFEHLSQVSDGFRKPLATTALSQETGAVLGSGTLSIADNRVDQATGSVVLKARFPNPGRTLWPGQFVNVQLGLENLSNVTTIPTVAVNNGPSGTYAFVIGPDSKVVMRPITVALTQGAVAVIKSGIRPGETVVTDGQMTLRKGALVSIRPSQPATPGRPAP